MGAAVLPAQRVGHAPGGAADAPAVPRQRGGRGLWPQEAPCAPGGDDRRGRHLRPAAPAMVASPELGIDITSIGVITSVFPLFYGCSKFVSGVVGDVLSGQATITGVVNQTINLAGTSSTPQSVTGSITESQISTRLLNRTRFSGESPFSFIRS